MKCGGGPWRSSRRRGWRGEGGGRGERLLPLGLLGLGVVGSSSWMHGLGVSFGRGVLLELLMGIVDLLLVVAVCFPRWFVGVVCGFVFF